MPAPFAEPVFENKQIEVVCYFTVLYVTSITIFLKQRITFFIRNIIWLCIPATIDSYFHK